MVAEDEQKQINMTGKKIATLLLGKALLRKREKSNWIERTLFNCSSVCILWFGHKKVVQTRFVFQPLYHDFYRLLIPIFTDHWVPRLPFVYLINEARFLFMVAFHKAFNNVPKKTVPLKIVYLLQVLLERLYNNMCFIPMETETDIKLLFDTLHSKKNILEKYLQVDIALLKKRADR